MEEQCNPLLTKGECADFRYATGTLQASGVMEAFQSVIIDGANAFAGVFDGYGGKRISHQLSETLGDTLLKTLKTYGNANKQLKIQLIQDFLNTDEVCFNNCND